MKVIAASKLSQAANLALKQDLSQLFKKLNGRNAEKQLICIISDDRYNGFAYRCAAAERFERRGEREGGWLVNYCRSLHPL